jgi:hypothetical protein
MPGDIISNPGKANQPPGALMTAQTDDFWSLDPSISLATLTPTVATIAPNLAAPGVGMGECVYLQGWNGATSAASGSPAYPTVALSTTTAQGNLIGVIVGTTVVDQPVNQTGAIVMVRRFGIAKVIVDNTTVVGHALVQSTGTAGALHDSGGVGGTQGETVGFALQALTVSSGLGYVLAFIKLT